MASLPSLYGEALTPNAMVFGDRGLWEMCELRRGPEGWVLMMGLLPLSEETKLTSPFPLSISMHMHSAETTRAHS